MATTVLGNKNNPFTAVFSASAKTLAISRCTIFDLTAADLESIYDTTTTSYFRMDQVISCTRTTVAGLPVFTYLFAVVPAGAADSDTLVIRLQVPDKYIDTLLLQVISFATT